MTGDPRNITEDMARALLASAYIVMMPSGALFRSIPPSFDALEKAERAAVEIGGYVLGLPVIMDCTKSVEDPHG